MFEDDSEFLLALKDWVDHFVEVDGSNRTSAKLNELLLENKRKKDHRYDMIRNESDILKKSSMWIVGGDGWAYDIGFGGLDHILSKGDNVNILILDTEMYSNTGGQSSKSTPMSASVKFAQGGMRSHKKDLGQMAMLYENCYVASIALGADYEQSIKGKLKISFFFFAKKIMCDFAKISMDCDFSSPNEKCF